MVTITNGVKTFRVTAGAVKPYKSMGFYVVSDEELKEMHQAEQEYPDDSGIVDDTSEEDSEDTSEEVNKKSEEDIFIEELLEKPLSQWSNEEVKEFVKIKGIDTSGAQKVSQVRGIIKAYLEEERKKGE